MKKNFLILALLFAVNLFSAEYWVDNSAVDTTGTGTISSPWKYIGQMRYHLSNNMIVNVDSGSYNETNYPKKVETNVTGITSAYSGIKIVATGPKNPVIYLSGTTSGQYFVHFAIDLTLKGLTFKSFAGSGSSIINFVGYGDLNIIGCIFGAESTNDYVIYQDDGTLEFDINLFNSQFYYSSIPTFNTWVDGDNISVNIQNCSWHNNQSAIVGTGGSMSGNFSFVDCIVNSDKIAASGTLANAQFTNCSYSSNVSDLASYTWTNSTYGDPLLTWNSTDLELVVSSLSPAIGAGKHGDAGHLYWVGLKAE